jgi:hypothetical protein
VPVEFFPPATLAGDKVTDEIRDGLTVSGACFIETPLLAVMTIELEFNTVAVVMLKIALVNPAGTVTLTGTVATVVSLELRFTVMPPAYAGAGSVTVPRTVAPFTALGTDKLKVDSTGSTVIVAIA